MKEQKKISLFETRDLGRNIETSFDFIKQNYGTICRGIVFFIPLALIAAYLMPTTLDVQTRMSPGSNVFEILGAYGIGFWLAYVFIALAGFFVSVYTVCYMAEYAASENGSVDPSNVWAKFKNAVLPLFGAQILYGFAISLGTIFCIIPGIFLAVSLIFYSFVYVVEEEPIIDSLKRSYNIVKGHWWSVFGYILLVGIVVYLISAIFSIPIGLATIGEMFNIGFFGNKIYHFIASVIAYVGSLFIAPFMYIALGVLYFSLRTKDEGLDMETRIDDIGVDKENSNINY